MENDIIYVAGDPDAYPLEYYDADSRSYQGVIPELLRLFSEQSGYDVRYYQPEKGDQRMALAVNQQVDIISCPEDLSAIPYKAGANILLFEDDGDGQPAVLCLLNNAPQGLAEALQTFVSGFSRQKLTALVIQTAQQSSPADRRAVRCTVGGLLLFILLLAAVLVRTVVSGRRRMQRMRSDHETDPVTGLGNQVWLARRCQTVINDRNRVLYTMFCFSLAPSAVMSDGDEISRQMASALQDCISESDLLARVSENCFAVLRMLAGGEEVAGWMTLALERLRGELLQRGRDPHDISAGACPLRAGGRSVEKLLSRAIYSAQQARQTPDGWHLFSGDTLRAVQQEQRLLADARHALENSEFQLYIQFYVSAFTGHAVGGEVLVFWEHPEQGILPPERFLPLLAQAGLRAQLDEYALEHTCAALENLWRQGKDRFFLLYGVSEQTLRTQHLKERLTQIAETYPQGQRQMFLGIPQRELENGADHIRALQGLEMRMLLNEFDGQLAAMAPARDIPLSGVKLSAGFSSAQKPEALLRAAVHAGHELGLAVLAEGADTEDAAIRLRQQGCDMLRGSLYARPLPLWEAMRKVLGQTKGRETDGQ